MHCNIFEWDRWGRQTHHPCLIILKLINCQDLKWWIQLRGCLQWQLKFQWHEDVCAEDWFPMVHSQCGQGRCLVYLVLEFGLWPQELPLSQLHCLCCLIYEVRWKKSHWPESDSDSCMTFHLQTLQIVKTNRPVIKCETCKLYMLHIILQ